MTNNAVAKTFDAWVESGRADGLEQGHKDVVQQVIARMDIRAGMQTLDLGCGTGWATRVLAASAPGSGAVGVDVSPAMIKRAEELHDLTSRARYEAGPFEALDFPDGKFDRVFSMEALYYSTELDKALGEAFRVMKSTGTLHLVVDRFKESPHTESWEEMVGVPLQWLSEAEWTAAIQAAGFSDVTTERVIDSRGPGDEDSFQPTKHTPDYQTRVELHGAGSLYCRAVKP